MFWRVRWSNYDWKKGTVIWPSVGMFGGSMSSDCFGRFLDQIATRKKGTVIWPLVAMFGGFHELGLFWWVCRYVFWWVPWSNYKLQPEKGTVVWPSVGMSTTFFWLILNGGCSSSELIVIKINTESEYNSNLQIGMALSIKQKNYGI